ncbi:PadR family transcriptional regulator [Mycetocola zhujimingii]|uniref:PadR family transcriptional regulator n=1 Tax=Mycetocola zhujimingii TaxID=2079792 RepID=A0A2U1TB64_9MICO|nr:PadR family transcriptional regulator [Mycetocola zhujimingii]PWC06116.1 PadR family transcriptional regulator [Mycetocola zhujimingii]
MSPVFGHGSLRLYLLSLLAEGPKHGYELIQALSERFGGTYSPSAGTIYPRLAKLEEEGLVTSSSDGRKTVYSITDAGRRELEDRRVDLDAIELELTDSVRRLADEVRTGVTHAMRTLKADLASAAQQAKQSATSAPSVSTDDTAPRTASRIALHDADTVLADFRQAIRLELRGHVSAGGTLSDDVVRSLKDELDRVRASVRNSLGTPQD